MPCTRQRHALGGSRCSPAHANRLRAGRTPASTPRPNTMRSARPAATRCSSTMPPGSSPAARNSTGPSVRLAPSGGRVRAESLPHCLLPAPIDALLFVEAGAAATRHRHMVYAHGAVQHRGGVEDARVRHPSSTGTGRADGHQWSPVDEATGASGCHEIVALGGAKGGRRRRAGCQAAVHGGKDAAGRTVRHTM